jgi:predicted transcriptional regulator
MAQTTVRITEKTRDTLRRLARAKKQTMQLVLEQAVETYRHKHFLEQLNQDFATLKKDDKAWAELKKEYDLWDTTIDDGLDK